MVLPVLSTQSLPVLDQGAEGVNLGQIRDNRALNRRFIASDGCRCHA
jgi:hypothetical protein